MQAQPPSTKRTSQKLIRDMGDAVISVSLSDDGTLAAAGTTAARTVVFSVADNTELTSIQLKSGVNAVVFLGSGEYTTITVGTFNGFINTYFTCVPLSNGKTAPMESSPTYRAKKRWCAMSSPTVEWCCLRMCVERGGCF